jgi:hypothetical protein
MNCALRTVPPQWRHDQPLVCCLAEAWNLDPSQAFWALREKASADAQSESIQFAFRLAP